MTITITESLNNDTIHIKDNNDDDDDINNLFDIKYSLNFFFAGKCGRYMHVKLVMKQSCHLNLIWSYIMVSITGFAEPVQT